MKCELCDADATFHMTEANADGDSVSRSLCEDHGRQVAIEAGLQLPSLASIVASTKRLSAFLRANGRMPTAEEMMVLGGSIGPPRQDADESVDTFIAYLDSLAEFIDGNGRFPTEDELRDPF